MQEFTALKSIISEYRYGTADYLRINGLENIPLLEELKMKGACVIGDLCFNDPIKIKKDILKLIEIEDTYIYD